MTIADRIATLTAEHAAARAAAGVTSRTRTRGLTRGMPDRLTAERATRAEREADARRLSERERHAEATRLARRMRGISDAQTIAERDGDVERAARLSLLYGDVESARDRYVDATFRRPAMMADWQSGGRFARYARRYDLGFIGYTPDDVMQDAAELLAAAGLWSPAADGSAGHTIGDAYRALKHAYRRGLGFYGYERRGKIVERDLSERGYQVVESSTLADIRHRAHDDAAAVRALMADAELDLSDTLMRGREAERRAELLPLAERRRRALGTLANRFPLNADGRMLALATLLTEGYTVEELTEGLGVSERTLDAWANELGAIAPAAPIGYAPADTRDAFEVVDDLIA